MEERMAVRKPGIVSDGFNAEECRTFIDLIEQVQATQGPKGHVARRLLDVFDPLTTGLDKLRAFQRVRRIQAEEEAE
jgi:hypothetical protein